MGTGMEAAKRGGLESRSWLREVVFMERKGFGKHIMKGQTEWSGVWMLFEMDVSVDLGYSAQEIPAKKKKKIL